VNETEESHRIINYNGGLRWIVYATVKTFHANDKSMYTFSGGNIKCDEVQSISRRHSLFVIHYIYVTYHKFSPPHNFAIEPYGPWKFLAKEKYSDKPSKSCGDHR